MSSEVIPPIAFRDRQRSSHFHVSPEEEVVITCIDWTLMNLRKQFHGLKNHSMLTPVFHEHRVVMMVMECTLLQLKESIEEKTEKRSLALFSHLVDVTADHPVDDPRTGVWQILSWYKKFEYFRLMKSQEQDNGLL